MRNGRTIIENLDKLSIFDKCLEKDPGMYDLESQAVINMFREAKEARMEWLAVHKPAEWAWKNLKQARIETAEKEGHFRSGPDRMQIIVRELRKRLNIFNHMFRNVNALVKIWHGMVFFLKNNLKKKIKTIMKNFC